MDVNCSNYHHHQPTTALRLNGSCKLKGPAVRADLGISPAHSRHPKRIEAAWRDGEEEEGVDGEGMGEAGSGRVSVG